MIEIFLFHVKYQIPYTTTHFIPETIHTCKVSIVTQSIGVTEGDYLTYQPFINGKPSGITVNVWDLGRLIEEGIASELNWNAMQRNEHDLFMTGKHSEELYEVANTAYCIWTASDKTCWRYDAFYNADNWEDEVSPLYDSIKVQPSFEHFRNWVLTTIKEL